MATKHIDDLDVLVSNWHCSECGPLLLHREHLSICFLSPHRVHVVFVMMLSSQWDHFSPTCVYLLARSSFNVAMGERNISTHLNQNKQVQ